MIFDKHPHLLKRWKGLAKRMATQTYNNLSLKAKVKHKRGMKKRSSPSTQWHTLLNVTYPCCA